MRNPARIPEVLRMIQALWIVLPDLRLGQLIEKIAREAAARDLSRTGADPFYLEDDDLLRTVTAIWPAHLLLICREGIVGCVHNPDMGKVIEMHTSGIYNYKPALPGQCPACRGANVTEAPHVSTPRIPIPVPG